MVKQQGISNVKGALVESHGQRLSLLVASFAADALFFCFDISFMVNYNRGKPTTSCVDMNQDSLISLELTVVAN